MIAVRVHDSDTIALLQEGTITIEPVTYDDTPTDKPRHDVIYKSLAIPFLSIFSGTYDQCRSYVEKYLWPTLKTSPRITVAPTPVDWPPIEERIT